MSSLYYFLSSTSMVLLVDSLSILHMHSSYPKVTSNLSCCVVSDHQFVSNPAIKCCDVSCHACASSPATYLIL